MHKVKPLSGLCGNAVESHGQVQVAGGSSESKTMGFVLRLICLYCSALHLQWEFRGVSAVWLGPETNCGKWAIAERDASVAILLRHRRNWQVKGHAGTADYFRL